MSNARLPSDGIVDDAPLLGRVIRRIRAVITLATQAARGLGFWSSVVLPLAYLPLLFGGIESVQTLQLVVGLVAVNLLAVIAGRGYDSE